MHQTCDFVISIISLGKGGGVVREALSDYLVGATLQPYLDAEAQYAALRAQPDQPDIIDPETEVVVSSPNADRDEAIAALGQQYPYLIDPSDGTTPAERRPELNLDTKIAEAREMVLLYSNKQFNDEVSGGACALSIGWPIDCRRGNGKDDIGNMQGLFRYSQHQGLVDTDTLRIKGSDGAFHEVTVAQLRDEIIPEMDAYGMALFQSKWQREASIEAAATVAEVMEILQ